MASKNIHELPFDETTLIKLEIFEDYAQAWLPTFIMKGVPTICVFDFFAGTGYDISGNPGSPIRILKKIKEQLKHIFEKNVKINIYLNEYEPNRAEQKKFNALQKACGDYLLANKDVGRAINELIITNENFEILFPKLIEDIRKYPSLVYLDQNGIKYISKNYLEELSKTRQTDFLYFVSSSYVWRFGESEEFKPYLDIDLSEAKKDPYHLIHRNLLNQLKKNLPIDTRIKLYPFSLKKGSNIYGIIFGASHLRAVEKFLTIAWRKNRINGQANFDINGDRGKGQLRLFEEQSMTKIDDFKSKLENKLLAGEIKNNYDVVNFTYEEGHICNQAAEHLKYLKKNGIISYDGVSPLVTYENVFKLSRKLEYKILSRNEKK